MPEKITPLYDKNIGSTCLISNIKADENTKKSLFKIGIKSGVIIKILKGEINSSFIIELNDSQYILDWNIVKDIEVSND